MTKYNKLVRDKIPDIIQQDRKMPITHIASDEEYWQKLKEKLREEVLEFQKSDNPEELVDILEVIHAICDVKGITIEELKKIRMEKTEKRGGFKQRIILDRTE